MKALEAYIYLVEPEFAARAGRPLTLLEPPRSRRDGSPVEKRNVDERDSPRVAAMVGQRALTRRSLGRLAGAGAAAGAVGHSCHARTPPPPSRTRSIS